MEGHTGAESSSSHNSCAFVKKRRLLDVSFGILLLATLLLAAHYDVGTFGTSPEAKLRRQGVGYGKVFDVGSHYGIAAYHCYKFWHIQSEPNTIKIGLVCSFIFGTVATGFHSMLDGDYIPGAWFHVFFITAGSTVLFTYAAGLARMVSPETRDMVAFSMVQVCLLPPMSWLMYSFGFGTLLTKFTLNGHIFIFVSIATHPMLRSAHRATGMWQFKVAPLIWPAVVLAFVAENFMDSNCDFDSHGVVHLGALSFVSVLNAALSALYRRERERDRVKPAETLLRRRSAIQRFGGLVDAGIVKDLPDEQAAGLHIRHVLRAGGC